MFCVDALIMNASVLKDAASLFNRQKYFEAHDLLEDAWAGEKGPHRSFLHALIHLSVGMYHVATANHQGAVNLLQRAEEALSPYAPKTQGLDVSRLLGSLRICLAKSQRALAGESVVWEPQDVPHMSLEIE